MELSAKIVNNSFGKHCAGVSSIIKLLVALKKETPVKVRIFLVDFGKFLRTTLRNTSVQLLIEYKYNNAKMKRINIKHYCIFPHFIQFSKQTLLFIAALDDHHQKPAVRRSSSKKLFLKISQYLQENTCVGTTLSKRDSNADVFLWIRWLLLDIYICSF